MKKVHSPAKNQTLVHSACRLVTALTTSFQLLFIWRELLYYEGVATLHWAMFSTQLEFILSAVAVHYIK
jgi:hypothetical protein